MSDPQYYPITGIKAGFGPDGKVPERMEIDALWQSEDEHHVNQVSLFIAALIKFQKLPITDQLSYFQIAGIHAEPYWPWFNDFPKDKVPRRCTHAQILFPTWHRAFLLLFEQRVYELMLEVIKDFPDAQQPELKHAADTWRLPYWDWGVKKPSYDGTPDDYDVPQLIRLETVQIRSPPLDKNSEKKARKWVKNPLYTFRMPNGQPMSAAGVKYKNYWWLDDNNKPIPGSPFTDFSLCKATNRNAASVVVDDGDNRDQTAWKFVTPTQFKEGIQHNNAISDSMRDNKIWPGGNLNVPLREGVYRLLTSLSGYNLFATGDYPENKGVKDTRGWASVESLHNTIHDWIGGASKGMETNGHMAHIPVAAFDPIFWIHHCNVDRMLAIWQQLNPRVTTGEVNNWFEPAEVATRPLIPFRSDKTDEVTNEPYRYYTSNDVEETARLGYTYPEIPKTLVGDNVTLDISIPKLNEDINIKYGSTRRAEQKAALTATAPTPLTFESAFTDVDSSTKIEAPFTADSGVEDLIGVEDYIALIKFKRFALGGHPFTVQLFIGEVPNPQLGTSPKDFSTQVGEVYNFVSPTRRLDNGEVSCPNCDSQEEEGTEMTASIVLTNSLLTRYKQKLVHTSPSNSQQILESMSQEHVTAFLKEHFHWRVLGLNRRFIDRDRLPSFKVAVALGKADHFADPTKLSVYRDYEILYDVTEGREAGAQPSDPAFPGGDQA